MAAIEYPRLRDLQLYGLDSIEEPLWAALITADPVLLIGGHGTAKTALAERVAGALGEVFWAYDASKALFEDVIGFPDPSSLGRGRCRYVRTPMSIWSKSFVLVDEISRATPSMQNKWLEIIRSRRVMGISLKDLRYIFAAMNPPDYQGAYPLDTALVGRFGFILRMPNVWEMDDGDVAEITTLLTSSDAPGLSRHSGIPNRNQLLCDFVAKGRGLFFDVERHYGLKLVPILTNFSRALANRDKDMALDGRRMGLVYRGLMALFTVKYLKGEYSEVERMLEVPLALYENGLRFLLPYATQDDELQERLGEIYLMVAQSGRRIQRRAVKRMDPLEVVGRIQLGEEVGQEDVELAAETLVRGFSRSLSQKTFAKQLLVLWEFLQGVMEGKLPLGERWLLRMLDLWQKVTAANPADTDTVLEAAAEIPVDVESPRFVSRCALVAAYEEGRGMLEKREKMNFYLTIAGYGGDGHDALSV